jgi:four helix bundle protein
LWNRAIELSGDRVIKNPFSPVAGVVYCAAMISAQEKLRERTKQFALDIIRLTRLLPHNTEGWVIGKQMLRSGTSVAANYRAASRGRSHLEFVAKIGVVVEEADETVFWLELLDAARLVDSNMIQPIITKPMNCSASSPLRTTQPGRAPGKSVRSTNPEAQPARAGNQSGEMGFQSPDHPIMRSPDKGGCQPLPRLLK